MSKQEYRFAYEEYDSINDLNRDDASLLREAWKIAGSAYAPYSKFKVGAVAKLTNGQTVKGTNQENASYPVGICAERTLLASAATLYPEVPIETMAVSYQKESTAVHHPVSPCGMCRQALQEFEDRTNHPIRLILGNVDGKIYIIEKAGLLLPLAFKGSDLNP